MALRWRDVDFANALVRVERSYTHGAAGDTKSGKVRSVPMILEASSPLARLSQREHFPGPDDLVFPNVVGGHEQESALRRRYYATHERAGLRRIRFHDLRPTFGTLAVQEFAISDV